MAICIQYLFDRFRRLELLYSKKQSEIEIKIYVQCHPCFTLETAQKSQSWELLKTNKQKQKLPCRRPLRIVFSNIF